MKYGYEKTILGRIHCEKAPQVVKAWVSNYIVNPVKKVYLLTGTFWAEPVKNHTLYKGILATAPRLQALTQYISWPHFKRNEDHLASLGIGNYMDKTCYHQEQLGDKLRQLKEYFGTILWQLWDNFGTTLRQYSYHFWFTLGQRETTLRRHWNNFETAMKNFETPLRILWSAKIKCETTLFPFTRLQANFSNGSVCCYHLLWRVNCTLFNFITYSSKLSDASYCSLPPWRISVKQSTDENTKI